MVPPPMTPRLWARACRALACEIRTQKGRMRVRMLLAIPLTVNLAGCVELAVQ